MVSGAAALDFYSREFGKDWSDPQPTNAIVLPPFSGYAVLAPTARTLFINPHRLESGELLAKQEIEADERLWSIRILAQCQQTQDRNNVAAIVKSASRAWDAEDHPEPPVIGEYVSVYFPHREWPTLAKTYCLDARPDSTAAGEIWEFEVKANIRDKVNLFFEGMENVPEELEVWLVDDALEITQNLREQGQYAVAGAEHAKQLKLVVGKHDFVDEKLAEARAIPTTYELSQNFPNPFNPVTAIRYGLPKAKSVTLKIYNLLGAEVATLVNDEHRAAGYHVAIWDGRNKNGGVVASGVHVYRLQAGEFVVDKKSWPWSNEVRSFAFRRRAFEIKEGLIYATKFCGNSNTVRLKVPLRTLSSLPRLHQNHRAGAEENQIAEPGREQRLERAVLPHGLRGFDGAEIEKADDQTQRHADGAAGAHFARRQRRAEEHDDEIRQRKGNFQI
jgi:hypothetical protein